MSLPPSAPTIASEEENKLVLSEGTALKCPDHKDLCSDNPGNAPRRQTDAYIKREAQFGCHNYHPMPVVLESALGCKVKDVDGKEYYDFLSAYSSLNQGHQHPRIVKALLEQAQKLSLTSRAFYNDQLGAAEQLLCDTFGYDKCLFMNTGVESVESALKLARRWGYHRKKIPEREALIVTASGNFHGRTITVISFSDDPSSYSDFGPYTPGFVTVTFGDAQAVADALEKYSDRVCGVLLEPIQGEAGVVVPPESYLPAVQALCREHNVLLILDEIQTGLGRTGDLLCHYRNPGEKSSEAAYKSSIIRPDIVCMAKALGGGVYPVSCVLADDDVMLTIRPGEHGSTYGGNPLAAAVAIASLKTILDEKLPTRSRQMGQLLETKLRQLQHRFPQVITEVRGRGLLWGMIINQKNDFQAWDICLSLKKHGLLAKTTHEHIIRLSPPLIITQEQLEDCGRILETVIQQFADLSKPQH